MSPKQETLVDPGEGMTAGFDGHFIVIARVAPFQIEYVGIYDTGPKARARAKMHFHDTGQMTHVYVLTQEA